MSELKTEIYSMGYDEMNSHLGHKIVLNDVWDWNTNRQIGIEVRCADCDTEPIFEIVDVNATKMAEKGLK